MDETTQECQEKINSGEIDCETNLFNPCCFTNGSSDASGAESITGGSGGEFFADSFGKTNEFFDSIGLIEIGIIVAAAFAVRGIINR